ncbi:hypothetical protein BSL78_09748 [Apostichopus japonicus]|uniref:Uncharacterized protein n=1 Tax=Stichopus japonicus TaxID=307972 RepID=A0A2G8KZB3_STIJA|nr:hypothetical protein BSL78_09748 [Apostichopus japonicus]
MAARSVFSRSTLLSLRNNNFNSDIGIQAGKRIEYFIRPRGSKSGLKHKRHTLSLSTAPNQPIQSILSEVRPVNQSSRTVRPRVLTLVDCIKPIETVIGYHPLCSDVNLNRNQLSVIRQIPREDAFVTKLKLQCSLWNARSIREKTGALIGSILENGTDIFLLTETWLKNQNDPTLGDIRLSLSGYDVTHFPRAQRRGGGVAFITRKNTNIESILRQSSSRSNTALLTFAPLLSSYALC